MSSKSWTGEKELQQALQDLNGQHPAQISKIKHAVTIAMNYQNEFKMVVYEIEKYIKKASIHDKLNGLYVIDALCRQSRAINGKEKDVFCSRFSLRLKETFGYFEKASSNEKVSIGKLIEEWKKRDVFPQEQLQSFSFGNGNVEDNLVKPSSIQDSTFISSTIDRELSNLIAMSVQQSIQPTSYIPQLTIPQLIIPTHPPKSIDPRRRNQNNGNSSANFLNSEHNPMEVVPKINQALTENPKALPAPVRLCPFREGNCPFSDKCRFSHMEGSIANSQSRFQQIVKSKSFEKKNESNQPIILNSTQNPNSFFNILTTNKIQFNYQDINFYDPQLKIQEYIQIQQDDPSQLSFIQNSQEDFTFIKFSRKRLLSHDEEFKKFCQKSSSNNRIGDEDINPQPHDGSTFKTKRLDRDNVELYSIPKDLFEYLLIDK